MQLNVKAVNRNKMGPFVKSLFHKLIPKREQKQLRKIVIWTEIFIAFATSIAIATAGSVSMIPKPNQTKKKNSEWTKAMAMGIRA